METSKLSTNGYITVPVKLRRKYGMKKGTKVIFIEEGNNLVLQPLTKEYFGKYAGIFNDEGNELEVLKEGNK